MRFSQMTWVIVLGLFLMPIALSAQTGLRKKADKYYQLHDYDEAIKTYLRYINKNRGEQTPKARLADSYRHTNQLKEAEKWYKEVINISTIDPEFYFQYGKICRKQSRKRSTFFDELYTCYGEIRHSCCL